MPKALGMVVRLLYAAPLHKECRKYKNDKEKVMKVEQKCGIISRTMLNDAAISLTLEAGDMVRTA